MPKSKIKLIVRPLNPVVFGPPPVSITRIALISRLKPLVIMLQINLAVLGMGPANPSLNVPTTNQEQHPVLPSLLSSMFVKIVLPDARINKKWIALLLELQSPNRNVMPLKVVYGVQPNVQLSINVRQLMVIRPNVQNKVHASTRKISALARHVLISLMPICVLMYLHLYQLQPLPANGLVLNVKRQLMPHN